MTQHKTHQKEAMQHPGALYKSPEDILKDDSLSSERKLAVLKNWADSVQQKLEATSENMCPDEGSSCEEGLLQQITRCIDIEQRKGD